MKKKKDYLSYKQARILVKSLKIRTMREYWSLYTPKLKALNLPYQPEKYYIEWTTWGKFLSTIQIANKDKIFLSYEEAKQLLKKEKITSINEYNLLYRKWNLPALPNDYYRKEWIDFYDFFSKERPVEFFTYDEAKEYLKPFKFKTLRQFNEWLKTSNERRIPRNHFIKYKKSGEWISYPDFLSNNNISTKEISENSLSYLEAKEYVKQFNFATMLEFNLWVKKEIITTDGGTNYLYINEKDKYFPINCNSFYSEWTGWNDFLETIKVRSTGESIIEKYLIDHNIEYIFQYKLGCKYINPLFCDFYLPTYKMVIEFDGEQHFKPRDRFGGIDGLKITQERDDVKNRYCENEDIKLLRISYLEIEKIESILDYQLNFSIFTAC